MAVGGAGYGAEPDKHKPCADEVEPWPRRFEEVEMARAAETYALGPTRVQFQNKDPRGWREFADDLRQHSARGSALTLRGVQKRRPSLYELTERMKTITVPTLVMTGDEDWSCLEPALLMKRTIPGGGGVVMPTPAPPLNPGEPAASNAPLAWFFQIVDAGRWPSRDPRAMTGTILGR